VKIVADLIQNHESDPSKNIADMFIEKVLERAVQRIAVSCTRHTRHTNAMPGTSSFAAHVAR
jgi:hypothetical protein